MDDRMQMSQLSNYSVSSSNLPRAPSTSALALQATTLLEDDRRKMATLGQIPTAVNGLLADVDLDGWFSPRWDTDHRHLFFIETNAYRFYLDAKNGICAFAFWDAIHVWSYKVRGNEGRMTKSPFQTSDADNAPSFVKTYYMPDTLAEQTFRREDVSVAPLISTVTYGESSQLGLLACSVEGDIRFWEDILAPDEYKDVKIMFGAGDYSYDLALFEVPHHERYYRMLIYMR